MTFLKEENKRAISQIKLDCLKESVNGLEDKITTIVGLNETIYQVRQVEWLEKLKQIKATLAEDNYFLFIGRFSSGKSSFINKLIGIDILPTASVPCTSVVTEIRFADGPKIVGKVVYQNGHSDTVKKDDFMDMIIGKRKVENSAIHHLEFYLDINTLGDRQDSLKSLVDKVVIVDCPGFDSPYKFSDEILYEYIDKASFTFYLMPSDDFGGYKEVSRLGMLKKKTATLIPIISKSDRIEDEEGREEIVEQYRACMSSKFDTDDPIFVSSYKYDDFLKCFDKYQEEVLMETISYEHRNEINKLWIESGIPDIYNQIASKAKDSELNGKKVESVIDDFNVIVSELRKASISEEKSLRKELDKLGYNIESKSYKLLDANSKAIESFILDQAKTVGNELKNAIIGELAVINPKGIDKQRKVEEVFEKVIKSIQDKYYPIWEKRFKEYFEVQKAAIVENDVPNINDFQTPLTYIPMGLLDCIQKSGIQSFFIAAISQTVTKAAIASLKLLGGSISVIAALFGIAAFGYVDLNTIPSISDALNERKHKNEKQTECAISDLMDNDPKLNFEATVLECLTSYKEAFTKAFMKAKGTELENFYDNYQKIVRIKEELNQIQININFK